MIQGIIGQIAASPAAREEYLFYNDKFNTVLVIVLVILVSIFAWLFLSGRKMRKMEQQIAALEEKTQQTAAKSGLHP